ncbi:protein Son [Anthonomus grandis grandis]|uniref:protein Son n=1 Tax=Anthonomus grandis grandis TaxID=2921223 RepID=UPI002165A556|nr:protein Son [Anthonomus grandis grandis]XP_050307703.1 protein Son [Anthonomus grandis grandis]
MDSTKKEPDADYGGKAALVDTNKSSMQILSELFSTFDAEPPVIVKKEKRDKTSDTTKKSKKSKKKHKKHKKKSKKKKRSSSSSSSSSGNSEVDLAKLLIKQEKDKADEKIKIEGTSLSLDIKLEISKEEQKIKFNKRSDASQKIHIKDLHLSSIKKDKNKGVSNYEEGEILDSEGTRKRKKHKHDKDRSSKRNKTKERSTSFERNLNEYEELKSKLKKHRSPELERDHRKSNRSSRDRDSLKVVFRRSRERSRDRFYQDRHRTDYRSDYKSRHRDHSPYKDDGFYRRGRSRSRDRSRSRERARSRDKSFWNPREERYRSRDQVSDQRRKEREREDSSRIDKKKLLEIARRNAIQMMKSGSLPGALSLGTIAQEKMIAAIKSGGKSIDELTDFCKSLSKKEELGELSSLSEKEDSDADEPFHHPFKIKDRPTTITMNIKNAVPLPTKTTQERTTELRMQFPVSSGQQHRVNEEWVPVAPQTSQTKPVVEVVKPKHHEILKGPLAIEAPPKVPPPLPPPDPLPPLIPAPPNAPPGPQIFPAIESGPQLLTADIGSIVSQRLTALRKLQENPHDVKALGDMYKSNKEMETWAKSKQQFSQLSGQFTGSTGAQVLTQAELASGYQAWAKKNQLQIAAPVSGGMGMHLLQKMGWKPGEGLGKEKTGALEPLLLEVKLDKKGLVATEEQQKGKKKCQNAPVPAKTLQGKHPVSLLGEYASKKKLGAPQYILEFECGPDHKKNFLFKVQLNGVEYKPNVASANKKEAKANAAVLALKQIGLLQ